MVATYVTDRIAALFFRCTLTCVAVLASAPVTVHAAAAGAPPTPTPSSRPSAGTIDLTFGAGDGVAALDVGLDSLTSVDVLAVPGNRTVVATRCAMARFEADGSVDSSFGDGGLVDFAFDSFVDEGQCWDFAGANAQRDGRIVVAFNTVHTGTVMRVKLLRFTATGSPDHSYGGGDGVVDWIAPEVGSELGTAVRDIEIDVDGRSVVAGYVRTSGSARPFIARFLPDGTLDTSFSDDGYVADMSVGAMYDRLELGADGSIATWGRSWQPSGTAHLARYDSTGSLDTSFGIQGRAEFCGDGDGDMLRQSNGTLLIASECGLIRISETGVVSAPMPRSYYVYKLIEQPDGNVLMIGNGGGTDTLHVTRVFPSGLIDNSWGIDGLTTFHLGNDLNLMTGAAIRGDGSLIAGGYRGDNGQDEHEIVAVRLWTDLDSIDEPDPTPPIDPAPPIDPTAPVDPTPPVHPAPTSDPAPPMTPRPTRDLVTPTDGDDDLIGTSGRNTIFAKAGHDDLQGLESADVLRGDAGDDTVDGGSGADVLSGGVGDDRVIGGQGKDVIIGGAGKDVLDAVDSAGGDVVVCGKDPTTVLVDRGDIVTGSCARARIRLIAHRKHRPVSRHFPAR